ncbi:MAG: hypothetical protein HC917_10580 [Richelia sp. SM2_1_7]|nr:hypothetical protein [Richelia sp. SM2_1_7]
MKEISVTRLQYLQLLSKIYNITNKEALVLDAIIKYGTDRRLLSEILDINIRVISNYKSKFRKMGLIKNDKVFPLLLVPEIKLNIKSDEEESIRK